MSEKKHYPSWRYHKTHAAKIVHSEAEDQDLGHGWVMSPAHVDGVPASEEAQTTSSDDVIGDEDEIKPITKKKSKKADE